MVEFEVQESDRFQEELEEAILWLYTNNSEQSQEFADKKYFELQYEVNALKTHLKKNPRMGQADDISEIRRFPLYGGRYLVTWLIVETQRTIILLGFFDLKYPKSLRQFEMSIDPDGEED